MRFGRARWNWYDIIFLGLAAVIVYPDKVLEWIDDQTGKVFDWRHLVWLESIAVVLGIVAMTLLMPVYPVLQWWYPLPFVGIFALFRGIMWVVLELFGFHDL
jgi:hypothetical protein